MMKLPTFFISHGGGPWPWLKAEMPGMEILEAALQDMPRQLGATPKAILVISGHWETRTELAVSAHPNPPMLYDYYGFPAHTYQIKYPAPGSPELARRVQELLLGAGFAARLDPARGFDHGTFAPLYAIYPDANMPIVQLSMRGDYDPAAHIGIGRALTPLRDEGVLIIGSGLSYHNLRQMGGQGAQTASRQFDDWLQQTMRAEPGVRVELLKRWTEAPSARQAHPQEDHLIPLMVAVGAAEDEKAEVVYHEDAFFGNVTVSSFRFG